ncbi:MAG: hypothetical protein JNM85_09515 [Chthonomonas sp.]|nr:hypothetical protein [Chthonomonas sp.]
MAIKITLLGAGNPCVSPQVLAALATYFGERPLDVCLYDPDPERLDLHARLARFLAEHGTTRYPIMDTVDLESALMDTSLLLGALDDNGAQRIASPRPHSKPLKKRLPNEWSFEEQPLEDELPKLPEEEARTRAAEAVHLAGGPEMLVMVGTNLGPGPHVLSHLPELGWPSQPILEDVGALPHLILRWVRGDDSIANLLVENEQSPLKGWIDRWMVTVSD